MALHGTWDGQRASMRVEYSEVVSWERDQDALRLVVVAFRTRCGSPG
jgi:hypothetical protein